MQEIWDSPPQGKSHLGTNPTSAPEEKSVWFFAHSHFATGQLGFPPSLFILGLLQKNLGSPPLVSLIIPALLQKIWDLQGQKSVLGVTCQPHLALGRNFQAQLPDGIQGALFSFRKGLVFPKGFLGIHFMLKRT